MTNHEDGVSTATSRDAYVSLLYGEHTHFWLYALLLGQRLRSLDPDTPRALLVGKHRKDLAAPFLEGDFKTCLLLVWEIWPIELVQNEAVDRTYCKRHQFCFTKLRAWELPFERILFFDLDVLVRENPRELFDLPAPSGMFHGQEHIRARLFHASEIPSLAVQQGNNCVNAGLLRINPLKEKQARETQVQDMLREVARLDVHDSSYLPEQYYLFGKLPHWHHISPKWNFEVAVSWWRRPSKRNRRGEWRHHPGWDWVPVRMPSDWQHIAKKNITNVGMFHFSGRWCQPWLFVHLSPRQANESLWKHLGNRDSFGLLPFAVTEWLQAIEDMRKEFKDDAFHCYLFLCLQLQKLKFNATQQNWKDWV